MNKEQLIKFGFTEIDKRPFNIYELEYDLGGWCYIYWKKGKKFYLDLYAGDAGTEVNIKSIKDLEDLIRLIK